MPELTRLIEKGTLPHALLIIDGEKRAQKFAEQLVGSEQTYHPDVHHIYPEGKCHPISALRKLTEDASLTPFKAPYKVFLIHEADRMLVASANALLKTFEEPPERSIILLLTCYPDKLLPTILSRCQCYRFHESHEDAQKIEPLLDGLASGEIPEIAEADEACFEAIMKWYRDLYIYHLGIPTKYLFYPKRASQYASIHPCPLDKVEEWIRLARLGVERSLRFGRTIDLIQKAMNRV